MDAENLTHIALLKIDTEGYELEVLKGLGQALYKVDNIILEVLPMALTAEGRTGELLTLLENAGFEFHTVTQHPWKMPNTLPENNLWAYRRCIPVLLGAFAHTGNHLTGRIHSSDLSPNKG